MNLFINLLIEDLSKNRIYNFAKDIGTVGMSLLTSMADIVVKSAGTMTKNLAGIGRVKSLISMMVYVLGKAKNLIFISTETENGE